MRMKMPILEEVLSRSPSHPLYHYTDQMGFIGIIGESGESKIWATHTQYLNDRSEYLHAIDLVRKRIQACLISAHEVDRELLCEMESALMGIERVNVCVCSFSTERDSLSQWRAYGATTSSFAIGFPGEFLAAVAEKEQWYLAPCIYDVASQQEIVDALVQEVLNQNRARRKSIPIDGDELPIGGNLIAYLHRYAPLLKDYSFRDEKEWRLISRPLSCRSDAFAFRPGDSMLTPYYKLPLVDGEGHFRLHEVVVGPTPNPKQAEMSVRSFLTRRSQRDVPVMSSKIPYRSW
jgi:hypothetical protein